MLRSRRLAMMSAVVLPDVGPPMLSILSTDSWVRSLESLARPSRWAIQMFSCFSLMAKWMYWLMWMDERSISLGVRPRLTMKDLFILTKVFIHGWMSRLLPMAISTEVEKPSFMRSTSRKAESRTMSRWLEMKR